MEVSLIGGVHCWRFQCSNYLATQIQAIERYQLHEEESNYSYCRDKLPTFHNVLLLLVHHSTCPISLIVIHFCLDTFQLLAFIFRCYVDANMPYCTNRNCASGKSIAKDQRISWSHTESRAQQKSVNGAYSEQVVSSIKNQQLATRKGTVWPLGMVIASALFLGF